MLKNLKFYTKKKSFELSISSFDMMFYTFYTWFSELEVSRVEEEPAPKYIYCH